MKSAEHAHTQTRRDCCYSQPCCCCCYSNFIVFLFLSVSVSLDEISPRPEGLGGGGWGDKKIINHPDNKLQPPRGPMPV